MACSVKLECWKGIPIDDLTREELIEALRYYAGEVQRMNEPHARRVRAVEQAREFTLAIGRDPYGNSY